MSSEKKCLVFEKIENMPIPIVTFNKPLAIDEDGKFNLETKKALLYVRILNKRMLEIQQLKDAVFDMFENGIDSCWDIYLEYNHLSSREVGEKIIKEETKMIECVLGMRD